MTKITYSMVECRGARTYQGNYEPKCVGGHPCLTCQVFWAEARARDLRYELDVIRGLRRVKEFDVKVVEE